MKRDTDHAMDELLRLNVSGYLHSLILASDNAHATPRSIQDDFGQLSRYSTLWMGLNRAKSLVGLVNLASFETWLLTSQRKGSDLNRRQTYISQRFASECDHVKVQPSKFRFQTSFYTPRRPTSAMSVVSDTATENKYRFTLIYGSYQPDQTPVLLREHLETAVKEAMVGLLRKATIDGVVHWDQPDVPCQLVYIFLKLGGRPFGSVTDFVGTHRLQPEPKYWDLVNHCRTYEGCTYVPDATGGEVDIPGLWEKGFP